MERDFDLVDHEEGQTVNVIDLDAQDPGIVKDMIIKKQEDKIQALSVNLERAKWILRERDMAWKGKYPPWGPSEEIK